MISIRNAEIRFQTSVIRMQLIVQFKKKSTKIAVTDFGLLHVKPYVMVITQLELVELKE